MPKIPENETQGHRIVREVMGKRKKFVLYDRVALAVRIDGIIKIAAGEERHRCFQVMQSAMGEIAQPYEFD